MCKEALARFINRYQENQIKHGITGEGLLCRKGVPRGEETSCSKAFETTLGEKGVMKALKEHQHRCHQRCDLAGIQMGPLKRLVTPLLGLASAVLVVAGLPFSTNLVGELCAGQQEIYPNGRKKYSWYCGPCC